MKKVISFVLVIVLLTSETQAFEDINSTTMAKQVVVEQNTTISADLNQTVDINKTIDANSTSAIKQQPKKMQNIGTTIVQIVVTPIFIAGAIVAFVVTSPLIILDAIFGKKKPKKIV